MLNQYKTKYKYLSIILLAIWVLIIFVMLLLPNGLLQQNRHSVFNIPYSDKIVHCGLFAVFTFLLQITMLLNSRFEIKKQYLISLIISVVFGLFTEVLQALTYQWCGRNFDIKDYLSDLIGVVLSLLFFKLCEKKIKKRLQNEK